MKHHAVYLLWNRTLWPLCDGATVSRRLRFWLALNGEWPWRYVLSPRAFNGTGEAIHHVRQSAKHQPKAEVV